MTEQFDVFLCHNSEDKPEVKEIGEQLRQYDLKPWLDIWELPPGRPWAKLLEKQIEQINSVAVFVGENGLGPWQKPEIYAFLSEFMKRDCSVIPVLLPNVPKKPELPLFLRHFTWVDFRKSDPAPMYQLRWGITGKKPDQPINFKTQTNPVAPTVITEILPKSILLEMVKIPAGSFLMGTEEAEVIRLCKEYEYEKDWYKNEMPQYRVNLQEFYLGKYPITQEQYQAVIGNNPSKFKNNPKNPVETVSWDDAQAFCQKLSAKTGKKYRLPSEAEWEYACRAGTQTRYYFGNNEYQLGEYAWYRDNSGSKPHPVGQKKPNNWGLYDMHGNVWEWCEDGWHENYQNAPTDGTAWNENHSVTNPRVLRGGSWLNNPRNCRSAARFNFSSRYAYNGFRVVSPQDS